MPSGGRNTVENRLWQTRKRRGLELQFVGRGHDSHNQDDEHDPFELVTLRSRQRELVRHVANVARPRLTGAGGRHCVC